MQALQIKNQDVTEPIKILVLVRLPAKTMRRASALFYVGILIALAYASGNDDDDVSMLSGDNELGEL